ncbi:MAG: DUF721 domain-containing protein [Candidatus Doudnabacteria bacterium]|nr:DUF721 domain-containing protein [Candidatus Doudnabacteria bacterium]
MPGAKPLAELLPAALDRAGVSDHQLTAASVCEAFLKVVEGHPKLKHGTIQPVSYKYRMLTVQVEGAPLAAELQMYAKRLVHTTNRILGKDAVDRIRFSIR